MFDLSADVDDANITVEKTSKKRKREGGDKEKKKKIKKTDEKKAAGSAQAKKDKTVSLKLLRGNFFRCHIFLMKRVQNLKSFCRSSQNYFVLALFCSLHS